MCLGLLTAVVAVHSFAIDVLALLILAACLAYSPRGYVLEGQINFGATPGWSRPHGAQGVREAAQNHPEDLRGCIRLWGSGGLFGYYGLFRTAKLGKSTWYVTSRNNSVVVITAAKTVLFSPDEPDGFLAAIRAAAPIDESHGAAPIEPAGYGGSWGKWIAAVLAIVGMGAGFVAYNYSPGVPGYTLTTEKLVIHDRFYPVTLHASAVDIGQIRIVDLATDVEWRTAARTNGFANAHYRSGWFRAANGQKVRLYQADSPIVVLLPPRGEGSPVLYQAADPQKFIDEILAAWGASARSSAKAGKWIYYAL